MQNLFKVKEVEKLLWMIIQLTLQADKKIWLLPANYLLQSFWKARNMEI